MFLREVVARHIRDLLVAVVVDYEYLLLLLVVS
jgi:hypothetical protein